MNVTKVLLFCSRALFFPYFCSGKPRLFRFNLTDGNRCKAVAEPLHCFCRTAATLLQCCCNAFAVTLHP